VSVTRRRFVRSSRLTPRRCSSAATCFETLGWFQPSRRAAAWKPPTRATETNATVGVEMSEDVPVGVMFDQYLPVANQVLDVGAQLAPGHLTARFTPFDLVGVEPVSGRELKVIQAPGARVEDGEPLQRNLPIQGVERQSCRHLVLCDKAQHC
jgi:hypothetical protein